MNKLLAIAGLFALAGALANVLADFAEFLTLIPQ
jgi:hypothetical protein